MYSTATTTTTTTITASGGGSSNGIPIPSQLRNIIRSEGGGTRDLETCMNNIETAKRNELKAYLSLCDLRLLNIP
jgi:hypothetical protein